jgi:hypothetical protein
MSGTADDPIDLEALDAAIATANDADSTIDQRANARRALFYKTQTPGEWSRERQSNAPD